MNLMKIKSCPFCGKDVAEIVTAAELEDCLYFECREKCPRWNPLRDTIDCNLYCVVCNAIRGGCGVSTTYFDSEEKAIETWNRRTE